MSTVFISYSSIDRIIAARLATDLQAAGHEVWFDQWNITGRDPYWNEIQGGIESATHFVFLISPEAIASDGGAIRELYHASGLKPVPVTVPVLVRATPGKWPILISPGMYQYHDLVNHSYDEMLPRIKNAVTVKAPLRADDSPASGVTPSSMGGVSRRTLNFAFVGVLVVLVIGFFVVKGLGGTAAPTVTPTSIAEAATATNTTQVSTQVPTTPPTLAPTVAPTTIQNTAVPQQPKGTKIVFSRNGDIWVMDRDGKNAHSLYANSNTDEAVPAWSRSGETIAFRSRSGSVNSEIFSVDSEGGKLTQLTRSSNRDTTPDYSPDDKKIVYSTTKNGIADIGVIDADGSNFVNLTRSSGVMNYTPKWSPDGTRIVFSSNRSGNYEIWDMNSDGSNPTQLTRNGAGNYVPSWSADGKYIAFHSDLNGGGAGGYDIFLLKVDAPGDNAVDLTNSPGIADIDPAWSPDGFIAYASKKTGVYEIYVMNINGQGNQSPLAVGSEPAWGQ